jgi:putative nucleotidyltransferase-like protein
VEANRKNTEHVDLRAALFSFRVDRVTAEVCEAFGNAQIESILLKGPTIATWLYGSDGLRLYGDTDLLIRHADWEAAETVMRKLGFNDNLAQLEHPRMESGEGYPWSRGTEADLADVDLHYTIFGLGADPGIVWEAYSAGALQEPIGGTTVRTPSYAARLMHIALHAVQHGGEREQKPMVDLERALARASKQDWGEAFELAKRLEGASTFHAGLTLLPEGAKLARELWVEAERSVAASLRLGGVPLSEGFAELADSKGVRQKLKLVLSEVFPNAAFMRWWSPLARRGRLGLAVSYPLRLLWLAYRVVPGYRAWRRAARETAPPG